MATKKYIAIVYPSGEVAECYDVQEADDALARNSGAKLLRGDAAKTALFDNWRKQAFRLGIAPGACVYCVISKTPGASGMTRSIKLLVPYTDKYGSGVADISWLAAKLGVADFDRTNGGLKMRGCGMDMGFQAVYNLGCALWPEGTPEPHGERNGEPDSNGGYALKHRWI